MLTIDKNNENIITINKSKFITKLFKVNNENEVKEILKQLKIKYSDSTHICYGYIINGKNKASDDNEPSGSAGIPILNVLKQNNLDYILCVVIRYFGGIKLGIGGLFRAYSNSVSEILKKCNLKEIQKGKYILISFNYNDIKTIDFLLKDSKIINKHFDIKITYEAIVNNETFNKLKKYNLKIIKELII